MWSGYSPKSPYTHQFEVDCFTFKTDLKCIIWNKFSLALSVLQIIRNHISQLYDKIGKTSELNNFIAMVGGTWPRHLQYLKPEKMFLIH